LSGGIATGNFKKADLGPQVVLGQAYEKRLVKQIYVQGAAGFAPNRQT
jgi:hypothetical protein